MLLVKLALCLSLVVSMAEAAGAAQLRVCADPNNLPFSNEAGEGFENKIVALIARDLGVEVVTVWRAQRRGYIRNTLEAGLCDLLPGVPTTMAGVHATRPYYRSMYVFVAKDAYADISSFDDPRLEHLKIGVQLIGDAGFNTPPAQALAKRGRSNGIVGYPVFGDYSKPNPPAAIIEAVAKGNVDVAIAWGPMAGYFAAREPVPLHIRAVSPLIDGPLNPMMFDVAMGVALDDPALFAQVDGALTTHAVEISAILDAYHVPQPDK